MSARGERTAPVLPPAPLRASFAPRPERYRGAHRPLRGRDAREAARLVRWLRRMAPPPPAPVVRAVVPRSSVRRGTGTGWPAIALSAVKINFVGRHDDTPSTVE